MTKKRDVEILAPAGSTEQLIAAVNNGCDSVYLGLASFNARMKAPNFTSDNIAEWIDYCHVFGVKVYVAINTSLKNSEFDNAVEMLLDVYNKHADGVILTDTALIQIAAKLPKPFDIVASTQLNIHDAYGAEFLLDIGATTVVCARESDIDSIRNIVATGIKAECFIHGATCVCQSGQCLFSSMVGGNSGNRGLCAQPCRKKYSANGGEYKYLLSARDLCGLDVAKELYEAGVTTYKIEGRNRRAEYAGITSEVYGKLFDNGFNYNDNDIVRLKEIYNRDMSELTYLHGGAERIISPDSQNHTGVPVGIVRNGGIESTVPITKGDGFKIMNEGVEVCGGVALESGRGRIAAEFSGVVKNGMSVRRTTSIALCDEINAVKKRLSISLQFVARHGEHARLKAVYEEISAEVVSDYLVQQSQKIPTTVEEIDKQLRKTGNSYYTISDIDIGIDEVFLAKSQINELRRAVIEKLTKAISDKYNDQFRARNEVDIKRFCDENLIQIPKNIAENCLGVICYDTCQLDKVSDAIYKIYKPEHINSQTLEISQKSNVYLDIPSFTDSGDLYGLLKETPTALVCHNLGHVQLSRKLGLHYIAGSGLNIYNDRMATQFADADTFVYSTELSLNEIRRFANQGGLIFVDGAITLMKFVHCPYMVSLGSRCDKCMAGRKLIYTDEQGNRFEIVRRKDKRCTFELINGKKLSVSSRLAVGGRYMIDYNEAVLRHYTMLNKGINDGYIEKEPYTKGRLTDGVK